MNLDERAASDSAASANTAISSTKIAGIGNLTPSFPARAQRRTQHQKRAWLGLATAKYSPSSADSPIPEVLAVRRVENVGAKRGLRD
jgi:hypothetical protein